MINSDAAKAKNNHMKKILLSLVYFLPVFLLAQYNYPATKKIDTVTNYHGTLVPDPYRWLEDDRSEETKHMKISKIGALTDW